MRSDTHHALRYAPIARCDDTCSRCEYEYRLAAYAQSMLRTLTLCLFALSSIHAEPERCQAVDMPKLTLGDGHEIPAVGLGLYYTKPGAETYDIVTEALKMGYRHFDTAGFYENEADVGRAIRDSGIPRDEIHVRPQ